jgi:predicted dehydrogenase
MSLKAAVIGVGYLGRHHARIYSSLEGVELIGVADASKEARESVAEQYGTRAYADFRDVIHEADVLSIVTPTVTHFSIAMECLKAGKDILIEKPVTATLEEANKLLQEAHSLGSIVQVGHLERYNPAVIAMGNMVKPPNLPYLIEAERVSPYLGRATDVDTTLDLMIHDIDIVASLLARPDIKSIRAAGSMFVSGNIDAAKAWLEFEGGAVAILTASRVANEKKRLLRVYQGDECLELDYQNMKILRKFPEDNMMGHEEIPIQEREPLREEIVAFIECVREKREPMVSIGEGLDALEVAMEISQQIRKAGKRE